MLKRAIFIEAAILTGVLAAGLVAVESARAAAQAAPAADPRADVKIESMIKVERTEQDASGNSTTTLLDPSAVKVIPGDRLVFINAYRNTGRQPVSGFVVNNPVHPAVALTEVQEDWAMVSVDGGKTYGKLADLTITEVEEVGEAEEGEASPAVPASATRAAVPADVTHIRWTFSAPIAPGEAGELRFRGIVK